MIQSNLTKCTVVLQTPVLKNKNHSSDSIQMRVNEPTTFNSGLALCLFLSGPPNNLVWSFSCKCCSGILGSFSLIVFCWLTSLEDESTLRPTLCGLLITSRYIITYVLSVYLFFSFVFRMLLVLYADRGLVGVGGTNLKLFHHLFWLIFTTLVVQVNDLIQVPSNQEHSSQHVKR